MTLYKIFLFTHLLFFVVFEHIEFENLFSILADDEDTKLAILPSINVLATHIAKAMAYHRCAGRGGRKRVGKCFFLFMN